MATYTVLSPVRHDGVDYPEGATLELPEASAEQAVALGALLAAPLPDPLPIQDPPDKAKKP